MSGKQVAPEPDPAARWAALVPGSMPENHEPGPKAGPSAWQDTGESANPDAHASEIGVIPAPKDHDGGDKENGNKRPTSRRSLETLNLRDAEEEGTVNVILKTNKVNLASFPAIADAHLEDAVAIITDGRDEKVDMSKSNHCEPWPTVEANLLGNYLMVPSPAAEDILKRCLEPMVVLSNGSETPSTTPSEPHQGSFPNVLGPVFLRRLDAAGLDGGERLIYKPVEHKIFLNGELGHECETSPPYPCTLEEGVRKAALVPLEAKHFCYVFTSDGLAVGGFLYLDYDEGIKDWKALAVNAICFTPTTHALAFKKGLLPNGGGELVRRISLSPDTIRYVEGQVEGSKLFRRSQKKEITVDALSAKGATHYAFIEPGIIYDDGQGFNSGLGGGFAYWLKNGETVYFEVYGAGEVVSRSIFPELSPVTTAMLPDNANESELIGASGCSLSGLMRPSPLIRPEGKGWTSQRSSQVTVARLRIKDPLHPMVLRGLTFAPRREVLDTIAAKAIAQLAFEDARGGVLRDVAFRSVNVTCLALTAKCLREGEQGNVLLYIMAGVWLREALKEMCLIRGYLRNGWLGEHHLSLSCRQTAAELSYHLMMFLLLLWMAECAANGEKRLPELMRALVAFVGAITWMSLLYMLRGFRAFRLGTRILPVFQAVWDICDFVLISAFFVAAGAHAGYSLSPRELPPLYVMFAAYRLGFLGDFDVVNDVEWNAELEDGEMLEQESVIRPFQYMCFMIMSFVVAIAMTNILVGAMSSAFDSYMELAQNSFVKHQAWLGLDHALIAQGAMGMPGWLKWLLFGVTTPTSPNLEEKKVLWCSYRKENMDDAGDQSLSFRKAISSAKKEMMKASTEQHSNVLSQLKEIHEKMSPCEDKKEDAGDQSLSFASAISTAKTEMMDAYEKQIRSVLSQLNNIQEEMASFKELAQKLTQLVGSGAGQAVVRDIPVVGVPEQES